MFNPGFYIDTINGPQFYNSGLYPSVYFSNSYNNNRLKNNKNNKNKNNKKLKNNSDDFKVEKNKKQIKNKIPLISSSSQSRLDKLVSSFELNFKSVEKQYTEDEILYLKSKLGESYGTFLVWNHFSTEVKVSTEKCTAGVLEAKRIHRSVKKKERSEAKKVSKIIKEITQKEPLTELKKKKNKIKRRKNQIRKKEKIKKSLESEGLDKFSLSTIQPEKFENYVKIKSNHMSQSKKQRFLKRNKLCLELLRCKAQFKNDNLVFNIPDRVVILGEYRYTFDEFGKIYKGMLRRGFPKLYYDLFRHFGYTKRYGEGSPEWPFD